MRRPLYIVYGWLLLLGIIAGCSRYALREVNLEPDDPRPVYRVRVGDSEEALLLQQRFGLDVHRVEGFDLYFFVEDKGQLDSVRAFGYAVEEVDASRAFHRVVKVMKKGTEAELLETGVMLINREDDFWVVRGDLGQIRLLQARGFAVGALERDPRPREIEIIIKSDDDVQRVVALEIDIFSIDREKRYRIYGAAFDYQIDALREEGFEVIVKSRLDSGGDQ